MDVQSRMRFRSLVRYEIQNSSPSLKMDYWGYGRLYRLAVVSCTNLLSGCSKIRGQDCKYLFSDKTQIFVLCIFHRYPLWWNHLHMIELIRQHLNSFHTNSLIINHRILTNIKKFYANLDKKPFLFLPKHLRQWYRGSNRKKNWDWHFLSISGAIQLLVPHPRLSKNAFTDRWNKKLTQLF